MRLSRRLVKVSELEYEDMVWWTFYFILAARGVSS
jgi:hypothetical protein